MYQPLVSIIIPVYNGSNYMREAIDSALSQTYPNIEVIVVNDGSNDNGATEVIARSYGDKIRYFEKNNGGVSSALNLGITEMRGEYFSWLSHDDVYEKDKIQKQIAAINCHNLGKNVIICCDYLGIDADSNPLSQPLGKNHFSTGVVHDSKTVLEKLLQKSTFNGCTLLIPRDILLERGMFDEQLRFCQDAFMWYKIFTGGCMLFCNEDVSVKNRIHQGQLTQRGQKLFRQECQIMSHVLAKEFLKVSDSKNNFLKLYLYSDARFFNFRRVREIFLLGKEKRLLSVFDLAKAYLICGYGHIRPLIRKIYYMFFRRIKTT